MPVDEERKRSPAVSRSVEDISENDGRVSVIGTIVDKTESRVVLDDGTGKLEVSFDLSKDLSKLEEGNLVRVVGRPREESLEGEVIQDFQDFDKELYKKALERIEKLRE